MIIILKDKAIVKLTITTLITSMTLIACGEGGIPPSEPVIIEAPSISLNDTGIRYAIGDVNEPFPSMVRIEDNITSKAYLSVLGNTVNAAGERFTLKPAYNIDGSPRLDADGRQAKEVDFDINPSTNQKIIEEIAYEQEMNDAGELVFDISPIIYTAVPGDFPDHAKVVPTIAPENFPGQDVVYGRDTNVNININTDGIAGFQFSKLDKDLGNTLPNDAQTFGCVKDIVTGLVWEKKVKENDTAYEKLHNSTALHTWYNPDSRTNGGDAGQLASQTSCTKISTDTFSFVNDVNTEALCGFTDWRVPTNEELRSIVDYNVKNGSDLNPMADSNFFPHVAGTLHRWTSQSSGSENNRAFGFHYFEGRAQLHNKYCIPTTDTKGVVSENYHNGTILVRGVYSIN